MNEYKFQLVSQSKSLKKLKLFQKKQEYSLGQAEYLYQECLRQLPTNSREDKIKFMIFSTDPNNDEIYNFEFNLNQSKSLAELISEDLHTIALDLPDSEKEKYLILEHQLAEEFLATETNECPASKDKSSILNRFGKKEKGVVKEEPKEELPPIPEIIEKEDSFEEKLKNPSYVIKKAVNMDVEYQEDSSSAQEEKEEAKQEIEVEKEPEEKIVITPVLTEKELLNLDLPEVQGALKQVLQPIEKAEVEKENYILNHLDIELQDSEYKTQLKKDFVTKIYSPQKFEQIKKNVEKNYYSYLNLAKEQLNEVQEEARKIDYSKEKQEALQNFESAIDQKYLEQLKSSKDTTEEYYQQKLEMLSQRYEADKQTLTQQYKENKMKIEEEKAEQLTSEKEKLVKAKTQELEKQNALFDREYKNKENQAKNEMLLNAKNHAISKLVETISEMNEVVQHALARYISDVRNKVQAHESDFEALEKKHNEEVREAEKEARRRKAEAEKERRLKIKEEKNRIALMQAEKVSQENMELTQRLDQLQEAFKNVELKSELDRKHQLEYQNELLEQTNAMKQQSLSSEQKNYQQELSKFKKTMALAGSVVLLSFGGASFGIYQHFENQQAEAQEQQAQKEKEQKASEEKEKTKSQMNQLSKQIEELRKQNQELKKSQEKEKDDKK